MSNESMVHARNTRSLDFFGNIIFNLYKYKVINDEKTINLEYDKKNFFNVFFPFSPILRQLNNDNDSLKRNILDALEKEFERVKEEMTASGTAGPGNTENQQKLRQLVLKSSRLNAGINKLKSTS